MQNQATQAVFPQKSLRRGKPTSPLQSYQMSRQVSSQLLVTRVVVIFRNVLDDYRLRR